jgi:glucose/arabinose dehydrogenase
VAPCTRMLAITALLLASWSAGEAWAQPAPLVSREVVTGFTRPVAFIQDPSNPRVQYVVEQGGRIRVLLDGALHDTDFLDLTGIVSTGFEQGVLGLAMPADYGTSGRAYVNFTDAGGNTVVARFLRSPTNPLAADPGSRFDFRWPGGNAFITQPADTHNGGTMRFGPDGALYIGTGDGGGSNDAQHNAQNPASLLGKMLRLDEHVFPNDPNGYFAPIDNPFPNGNAPAALDEIWAFGLRNPWKFSFDDPRLGGTGALVIGDVGQGAREEIDYEPAGAGGRNYGWRLREGTIAGEAGVTPPAAFTPLVEPLLDYPHSVGLSVVGGVVYRGTLLDPFYVGRYFYGDFATGKVFSVALTVDAQTGEATATDIREHTAELGGATALGSISAIETDSFGEMYIVSYNGWIVRIESSLVDGDADTLPDWWERRYGLDATVAAGADGAGGDPDADGVVNADEYARGGHPRGFHKRYLAEGATSSFFDVSVNMVNPGPQRAFAAVQFLDSSGAVISQSYPMPTKRRLSVNPKGQPTLDTAEFSTVVESDQPLVVSRSMRWDAATRYGSHAEQAVNAPSREWFLAEGATHSGFNLFYLLQNPNTLPTDVEVRYLRPSPLPPITRRYTVGPTSRTTIWVNLEDPGLASTDVSAAIATLDGQGIVVERALYLDAGGVTFGAGHDGAGVTAPALEWFLAEGATGDYVDLFVLIANPNTSAADVECRFLLPSGQVITRTFTVAGQSRQNVWVDSDPELAATDVSTVVRSTNGVPIVVERAIWWPGTFDTWHEGHVSAGTTVTASRWALAEGASQVPEQSDTYILFANVGTQSDVVSVELLFEDRPPAVQTFEMPANSRFTLHVVDYFPEAVHHRYGAIVSSTRGQPIVVESAIYSDAPGVRWAAGANLLATPLP